MRADIGSFLGMSSHMSVQGAVSGLYSTAGQMKMCYENNIHTV